MTAMNSTTIQALEAFAAIKPLPYGTNGTRDVNITTWHRAHEAAVAALSGEVKSAAQCSRCGGTGIVDDGEIDCYENGVPYENGPVKCVKDCPACTRPSAPAQQKCDNCGDPVPKRACYCQANCVHAAPPDAPEKRAEPDMPAICAALGFDPTNHHNAAKCPYCRPAPLVPLQARLQPWVMACFGEMIAGDREERNHRFFEEALELVQACDCMASEAHQLVDYVFGRPAGEKAQEAGGVMITLAALCLAQGLDMHEAGETELARISTKVEQIRAKQAAKPKHSPLPEVPQAVALDIPAGCEMARGWCVEVSAQGERVLLLSDVGYSGLADLEPWASTIIGCAEHLQAFVGPACGGAPFDSDLESLETGEGDAR
ncbi:hypothetical protein H6CHR_03075 [Variovorax sp. PBL-H6]|uniref:hypothetical protein n=1 Tax=Variovorax sp. PBL-H6 TaxID=434009 RepID=UPI001316B9A7|nr:hypothetical protein [Variovorax sp. PBL-H6]VTU28852.1 hypothetical protein H6CHR_03075 [Variovorax sp. PBL-H6]